MKFLDIETRLEMARAVVAVLRALKISKQTMTYSQLAKAIGIMKEEEPWEARHRTLITEILKIVGAVENQSGSAAERPLEFERIVTLDGEPGAGIVKRSRIISD